MKNLLLMFFFLFGISGLISAQTDTSETENEETFDVVEESPMFPGGTEALFLFIGKNFHYPDTCRQMNIQGRIYVSFIVEKDGSVKEAKILRGLHPALDEEALRVILMMPNWTPGRQRGKPVRVQYNIPIICRLK